MKLSRLIIAVLVPVLLIGALACSSSEDEPAPAPAVADDAAAPAPAAAPATMTFNEAPMLAALVSAGTLPPVEERLPSEPMVIPVFEQIGEYGGENRVAFGRLSTPNIERFGRSNLVRLGTDGNTLLPNAAKGWDVSDDGLVTTFYLREGMKWSDGAPFTADDFVYWYEDENLNTELNPNQTSYLRAGDGFGVISKVDDYTVRFTFPEPNYNFPYRILPFNQPAMAQPAHWLKQFHKKYNENVEADAKAAGFENWTQYYIANKSQNKNYEMPSLWPWIPTSNMTDSEVVVFERNPYYWAVDPEGNQLPYMDRQVHFKLNQELINLKVLAGELDMQSHSVNYADIPLFKQNEEKQGYTVRFFSNNRALQAGIYLNQSFQGPAGAAYSNKKVRQALSVAIDRNAIIQNVYLGIGKPKQYVPNEGTMYYPGDDYRDKYTQYDPALANQWLDEVFPNKDPDGFRLLPNGERVELEINSWYPGADDWTAQIPQYWNAVGMFTNLGGKTGGEGGTLTLGQMRAENLLQAVGYVMNGHHPFLEAGYSAPTRMRTFSAAAYGEYIATGGEAGLKPTPDMQNLIDLHFQGSKVPDNERAEVGTEIWRQYAENLWVIGVVGSVPAPAIIKNDIGNIPGDFVYGAVEKAPSTAFPEQWYWKSAENRQ
jgi:peptide/nickel transport system substrate-binding protein